LSYTPLKEDDQRNMSSSKQNGESWINLLKSARKTALIQDGRRKIHFTFQDGTELVEEYDVKTNDLIVRKWRKRSQLGSTQPWEMEVGEDLAVSSKATLMTGSKHLVESSANPQCIRKDTKKAFQWRIRNLPYPLATYSVTIDDNSGTTITVRTSNKKYFKKINVPDLARRNLKMTKDSLTFAHANNTLIIQYQKPKQVLDEHDILIDELKKMKISNDGVGDSDCKQS